MAQLPALAFLDLSYNQLSGQEAFQSKMEEHNPECELVLGDYESSEDEEASEDDY